MELLDLSDPDSFGDGFPHEMFRWLRREKPVAWHEGDVHGGPGYWIISRYEDIRQISRSPEIFSSAFGTNIQDRENQGSASEGGLEAPVLLDMDPPHHVRYRKLVSSGFTPRQIAGLEAHSKEIVRTIIDDVSTRGGCDFVTDIAAELPLQVIAKLLGCPAEDRYKIFEWSNRMIGGEDPEYMPEEGAQMTAAAQMFMYANGLAEDRLKAPRDDLMSTILHGEVDGERISMAEFDAFFLILAIAGNETTRNLIAHGMLQLIRHPEARARLIAEPELMPSAVEEMLRYCAPVMYFRRTAVEDTEIRGQKIRKGEKVTLWYPSGNRDEDVFPQPDVFDITRTPNHHLAFGVGEHFCLGTHLARQEIRAMFEQVLERLPDIELDGEVSYMRSHFIDGVKHIPVKFTPEAR
jgi:cholest-4-en-3-one 26-monooxygenase